MRLLAALIFCFAFVLAGNASKKPEAVRAKEGIKFDEYGKLPFKDEKARLDNFGLNLKSEPNEKGYIIVFAGSPSGMKTAQVRARHAINYLVNEYGVNPRQIIAAALDTELRDEFAVELWIYSINDPDDLPTILPKRSKEVLLLKGTEVDKRKGS